MIDTSNPKDLLLRYLLDKLPPEESTEMDQKLLSEEPFAELIEEARIDLIDDLAGNRLSFFERRRVRRALLGGDRQAKELTFAKALHALRKKEGKRLPKPRQSSQIWRWAAISTAAAFAIIFGISYLHRGSPGNGRVPPLERSGAATTTTAQNSLPGASTLTILLTPERTRGEAEIPVFTPDASQATIEIQIVLETASAGNSYKVVCTNHDGLPDLAFENLDVRRLGQTPYLSVRMKTQTLSTGLHRLRVFAMQNPQRAVESFSFRLNPATPVR